MPTQQELLSSAKAIDDRLGKSKSMVKEHKTRKRQSPKIADQYKSKLEAKASGRLI